MHLLLFWLSGGVAGRVDLTKEPVTEGGGCFDGSSQEGNILTLFDRFALPLA